jgi:hypothetical protein
MTRLSCHRFRCNEVRLWLSVMAYNLGNLWRRLVLPRRIDNWSLTSLQQRLVKTGGRLIKHARYYWLVLAESGLTRRLFGAMVRKDRRLTGGDWLEGGCWRDESQQEGGRDGQVCMEVAEKPGFGDFDVLVRRKVTLSRRTGTFARKPMQLAGSTGCRLVYNCPCLGTQNRNPGLNAFIFVEGP